MRTSLNLDDELMAQVRLHARRTGNTLPQVIEDALRQALAGTRMDGLSFRPEWRTVRGRLLPGVDLTDRDALYDLLEGTR